MKADGAEFRLSFDLSLVELYKVTDAALLTEIT